MNTLKEKKLTMLDFLNDYSEKNLSILPIFLNYI